VLRRHNTRATAARGLAGRPGRFGRLGDGWRRWSVSVGGVALAVCLLFGRRSERAVRALWDRLERAGVPSLRSHTHGRHVSYAVLRTWDLVAVSAAVAGLGAVAPVELTFDGVGLFRRGRAWLLAGASAEFLTQQERVVDVVTATGAELHKHYRPGRWVPHCSVAPRAPLAQLPMLVSALYEVLPLEARLDRVALIESATGEFWPVPASP
jgi:2'-5' RNA ligase